jgi:predicted neuraminidase
MIIRNLLKKKTENGENSNLEYTQLIKKERNYFSLFGDDDQRKLLTFKKEKWLPKKFKLEAEEGEEEEEDHDKIVVGIWLTSASISSYRKRCLRTRNA